MKRAILGTTAALAFFAVSDAPAATICVAPPSVVSCPNHTIQAGVLAANPGDIVKIAPGIYHENVVVGAGKDNIQILGTSKVTTIIDADSPLSGDALVVTGSNGVKVANLGIRNGNAYGIGMAGNKGVVSGVRIVGLHGSSQSAILVLGNGVQVTSNEVRGCSADGIRVQGNSNTVKFNTVAQVPRVGISVVGDLNTVQGNKIYNAGFASPYYSLYVNASATGKNVVSSNVVENGGQGGSNGLGLYVSDPEPTIQSNKLVWAGEGYVLCPTCNGGKVSLNTLAGAAGAGLFVSFAPVPSPAATLLVQGNRISSTALTGFWLDGPTGLAASGGVRVTQNIVTDTQFGMDCFLGIGSGHSFVSNIAQKCGRNGFYSLGDDLTFTSNQAQNVGVSGFAVDGYNGLGTPHFGATLTTNRTFGSAGQGFAIFDSHNGGALPTSTTGSGNTGLMNRQDFCNEGSAVTLGTFATTSTKCDIRN